MDEDPERQLRAEKDEPELGDETEGTGKPGALAVVAASVFMALPAVIPFYYALQAEGTMKIVLFAFGIGVLLVNALILVMVYRWILRMMNE